MEKLFKRIAILVLLLGLVVFFGHKILSEHIPEVDEYTTHSSGVDSAQTQRIQIVTESPSECAPVPVSCFDELGQQIGEDYYMVRAYGNTVIMKGGD